MKFPMTSAALNLAENKYAIVQEAKKDWQYYEAKIKASEECTGRLYREYKEGGAWEEHYKTWAAACMTLGKSRSQVNRLIQEDESITTNGALCAESSNKSDKKESAALNQVEQAREEPKTEPKEEEPEKPAVHSADEKPHNNGKAPKPENGKPKTSLVVWREMEETLIGRSLNRADELNRQCPNPQLHAKLIASLKAALQILEQWKDSIK